MHFPVVVFHQRSLYILQMSKSEEILSLSHHSHSNLQLNYVTLGHEP